MKIHTLLARHPDLVLVAFVVGIVATLLVPLPPGLLDVLLVLNIGFALTLLVTALYADRPLALSGFPTLLLLATLFRLALNVSSTRLILGTASAGEVIEAFGTFVVQGNYLVGGVVFLILTIIQFLVVAKGAERVAEVGARFTLDALPGKQLSIDADIRAGACTQAEGKARRHVLEQESRFYGALDGAMKFVKGDAVAGIVITVVNVLGGLVAGTVMQGMSLTDALGTFTLLSIGDGLVSQIPALLTAVAAGLVVTRVSGEDEGLASDLAAQLGAQPKALFVVGAVLVALGLVPGLPLGPFGALGLGAVGLGWALHRRARRAAEAPPAQAESESSEAQAEAAAVPAPVAVVLGVEVEEAVASELVRRLPGVRRSLGGALAIPVPGIRVRTGGLPGRRFQILVDEVPTASGEVPAGEVVAVDPDEAAFLGLEGTAVELGRARALALATEAAARRAREAGLEPAPPAQVLAARLEAALRATASELLTVQAVQGLVDRLEARAPTVVREAGRRVATPVLTQVLRRLLDEGLSLARLERILETFAGLPEGASEGPGAVGRLAERARQALGRHLVHRHARDGVLPVFLVDPLTEDLLREALVETPDGTTVALAPTHQGALQASIRSALGEGGVLLTSSDLRRWLWRLASTVSEEIAVLSFQELPADARLQPLGRVAIEGLDPVHLAA